MSQVQHVFFDQTVEVISEIKGQLIGMISHIVKELISSTVTVFDPKHILDHERELTKTLITMKIFLVIARNKYIFKGDE